MNQFNLYIGGDNANNGELINTNKVAALVANVFESFTIQFGIGHWKKTQEKTTIVTIFTDQRNRFFMMEYCRHIATELRQDCICLQSIESNGTMKIDFVTSYSEE